MDWGLFLVFVGAALFESLHPGPTIALVFDTRVRVGTPSALRIVAGVFVANIVWVAAALWLIYGWKGPGADSITRWVDYFALPFLVYLSSRRILESLLEIVASGHNPGAGPAVADRKEFGTGFFAHLLNPLSPAYYLASFSQLVKGHPIEVGLLYGAVPIVMDMLVFGLIAMVPVSVKSGHFPRGVPGLISGLLLFLIVSRVTSDSLRDVVSARGVGLVILGGILVAALQVAQSAVAARRGRGGRVLWRALAVWEAWFKVAAVVGTIVAVSTLFQQGSLLGHRLRICTAIATLLAVTLSMAKAAGELQDERHPTPAGAEAVISLNAWQTTFRWVAVAVSVFLGAVLLLMTMTGFRL